MEIHLVGRNIHLSLNPLNQVDKLGNLGIGKGASISIPDQADPDGSLVMKAAGWAGDMSPGKLLIPAIAHVDDAIAEAIAIPDQEVVAQPLQPEAEMQSVDGFEIARRFTGMMDDNARPAFFVQGSADLKYRVGRRLNPKRADIRRNQESAPGIGTLLQGQEPRDHGYGHEKR